MDSTVWEVLTKKSRTGSWGEAVYTVRPEDSVADAARSMNAHHIGSLLILNDGCPVGIISERDVLTRLVEAGRDPEKTRVSELMTPNPVTIAPSCSVTDAMRIMTERKVRHLPVVVRENVVGMVSIGDLVWFVTEELQNEVDALHSYIHGPTVAPTY